MFLPHFGSLGASCVFVRLLCLGLVWDSYRLLVRALAYSGLVPPACLAEVLRPYTDAKLACCSGPSPAAHACVGMAGRRPRASAAATAATPSQTTKRRFWVGVALWVALLATSISTAEKGTGGAVLVPTAGALVVLCFAFLAVLFGASERRASSSNAAVGSDSASNSLDSPSPTLISVWEGRALPLDDHRSSRVRVTWPNVLALVSVVLEALQLSALCITAVLVDNSDNGNSSSTSSVILPDWLTSGASGLSFSNLDLSTDTATDWARTAWICVALWMVVITLPLAQTEDASSSSSSSSSSRNDSGLSRQHEPVAPPVDLTWSECSSGLSRGAMAAAQEKCARAKASHHQQQQVGGGGRGGSEPSQTSIAASPPFRHATAFLGSFAFLSLVLVLQPGGDCWQNLKPGAPRAMSAITFLYYLVTTQVAKLRKHRSCFASRCILNGRFRRLTVRCFLL